MSLSAAMALAAVSSASLSITQQLSVEERLDALERQQAEEISRLERENEELRSRVNALEQRLSFARDEEALDRPQQSAASQHPLQPTTPPPPVEVGEKPEEEAVTQATELFASIGGILTPKGSLFGETSLNYTTSSDNRFFFSGVEIIDAFIVGAIEARDTDRTSWSLGQTFRYGLTNRLEMDVTVPYVQQWDRVANIAVQDRDDAIRDRQGQGLGDVSFGLHYQLNRGGRWPYVIANLRGKAPTGKGVFEVGDDEAATGSGYWTVEPSLTFIKRVDPVVLFGNIGYQANVETDVGIVTTDEVRNSQGPDVPPILTTTTTRFIDFDAGDAVRASFGIGIAMNERVNLNFGFDQSYIFPSTTRTETRRINVQDGRQINEEGPFLAEQEGQATTIASFLFGLSYRPTNKLRLGINTSLGATDEAPDVNVGVRSQYQF